MMNKCTSKQDELAKILEISLQENPEILEALELFDISQSEYINVLNQTKVITFSNSNVTSIRDSIDV